MGATRAAGRIGIPGLYVTADPGAKDEAAKSGNLSLHFGLGWAKSHAFFTGQTPVLRYNRALMMAILYDRIKIAKAVNTTVISLDATPQGYAEFDKGVARKFIIDPHGTLKHNIYALGALRDECVLAAEPGCSLSINNRSSLTSCLAISEWMVHSAKP